MFFLTISLFHLQCFAIPVDYDPFWWDEARLDLFTRRLTGVAPLPDASRLGQRKLIEVRRWIGGFQDSADDSNDLEENVPRSITRELLQCLRAI